ncbi:uncharacterized protein LOC125277453 [Megalobrama amblycephala]|uniref:uncharacterized protein LOC125277453 n=1 Tax=Megalobrama amblycephala TaxID=75352 RepID=UPI0020143B01|nr:uncharacterized protein LOC125277453 [Megalobrama amblycephala]XP_048061796.1 uncharacterized protein LOC125277453 [Megalobrama amblycephala]
MPSLQFLNMFGRQLTKMSIVTSVPLGFSLVGLQGIMDVKFSCPCKAGWNRDISALIFCSPALFALVIMLVLLRPFQYKCSCQDGEKTPQGQGNTGASEGDLKCCIKCCVKAFLVCWIPSLLWICICFIDGDYLACGLTNWNGRYACENDLHPKCFNWCKPTELSPEINETECYEKTQKWIYDSKIAGYSLAIIFCTIAIILVNLETSAETKTKDVLSHTIFPKTNTESTDEAAGSLREISVETKAKDEASHASCPTTNTESADEAAGSSGRISAETKAKNVPSHTNFPKTNTESAVEITSLLNEFSAETKDVEMQLRMKASYRIQNSSDVSDQSLDVSF